MTFAFSGDQIEDEAYARVLVLGPRKSGKTIAVETTAPGPTYTLSGDGKGSLQPAKRFGATLDHVCNVDSAKTWMGACKEAAQFASEGKVASIIVDTITLLINNILVMQFREQFRGTKDESFATYNNVYDFAVRGLNILRAAPAHLFVIAHSEIKDGELALEGKSKEVIPGLLNDIVKLDFDPGLKPPRGFIIGPSAAGFTGCRNFDETKRIPADCKVMLDHFGIAWRGPEDEEATPVT